MKNKTLMYGGGIVSVIVIVIVVVILSQTSEKASLDDILDREDCYGLQKWEEDHIFDDDLNITDEQMEMLYLYQNFHLLMMQKI